MLITNILTDAGFERLNARLKDTSLELLDGLRPMDDNVLVESNQVLYGPGATDQDRLFRLTEGNVMAAYKDRILFYFEPGELIGIDGPAGDGTISAKTDFAVRVDVFDLDMVLKKIRKDQNRFMLLVEYLALRSSIFQLLLASSMAALRRPTFQMRHYEAGAEIIIQGNTDKDVFSMITGRAEVLVDGRKVGEIREEEIFGEMSHLTGAPRSATVRATTACEVMVFGGEDFTNLAETNPTALMDIARNLSERLARVNQEFGR